MIRSPRCCCGKPWCSCRVNKAEIRADKITQNTLEKKALGEISKELNGQFTMADALEEGTGVVVDAADGKLHYDNTLETRLQSIAKYTAFLRV